MAALILTSVSQSSLTVAPKIFSLKSLTRSTHIVHAWPSPVHKILRTSSRRGLFSICSYKSGDESDAKEGGTEWPILRRWDVPWNWQTISLTSLACDLSFVLTGLIETAAIPYLGFEITELGLDEKAEILFVDQAFTTAVILGILYSITKTNQDPDGLY